MKRLSILLLVFLAALGLFAAACDDDDADHGAGDADADADGDADGDGDGDGDTFELLSDHAIQWEALHEASNGDIFLAESRIVSIDTYGPIVEITRTSGGQEQERALFDPGYPLFSYSLAAHPSGDLVLAGSNSPGSGGSNAWVGRVSMAGGGSIVWERDFGNDVSNQDNGFWTMIPTAEGYHLGGYGGRYWGEQSALRTFVKHDGTGGSHSFEFESNGGDISAFSGGDVSGSGDVLMTGFYGDFLNPGWGNVGYAVLATGDGEITRRMDGSPGLQGGGFDGTGRIFVFSTLPIESEDYQGDVYLAELNPTDLGEVWSKSIDYSHDDIVVGGDVNDAGEIVLGWHSWHIDSTYSWIAKFDSAGKELWVKSYARRNINDVVFSQDGTHVIAVGYAIPEQEGVDTQAWLIKLDSNGEM